MRIVISSEPKLLHIVRGVVTYYARDAGFPESDVQCLTMAVDEAAANVIRHAYGDRRDGKMALEILRYTDRIEFVIEDRGPKIRSDAIRSRSLDDVRPGGLGTFFIKCFVDSSSYDETFADGNRLRLVKYLPRKVSPSDESPSQKQK